MNGDRGDEMVDNSVGHRGLLGLVRLDLDRRVLYGIKSFYSILIRKKLISSSPFQSTRNQINSS